MAGGGGRSTAASQSIARFCDCKVWIARDAVVPSYVFFGFESDTTLASYLYSLINHAMRTELEAFRAAHPRLTGDEASQCIEELPAGHGGPRSPDRLDHMHQARDANVAAQRSTGTALMLIKHQVVEDAFRETEIRLVSAGSLTRARVNGAFRHGLAAGDRVNLNRPVRGDGKPLAAMTAVRDHQRGRVYAWEERFVAPRDPSSIAFAQAQGMVDAIWADMGLRFPPKVVTPAPPGPHHGRGRHAAVDPPGRHDTVMVSVARTRPRDVQHA